MRSKFCLSSVASFDKINRSLTNKSTNKQTFTFARGDRFENSRAMYEKEYLVVQWILMEVNSTKRKPQQQGLVMETDQTSLDAWPFHLLQVNITWKHFGRRMLWKTKELWWDWVEM